MEQNTATRHPNTRNENSFLFRKLSRPGFKLVVPDPEEDGLAMGRQPRFSQELVGPKQCVKKSLPGKILT